MVTITTEQGTQLAAHTDVQLAAALADHDLGTDWETGLSPFEEHTIFGEYLDYIAEFANFPNN